MKQVARDGDVIIVQVPKNDMDSLIRFIAHRVNDHPQKVLRLAKEIVYGDLTKQDEIVQELAELIDVADWSLVLNKQEALNLCDDLADVIYDQMPIHMATEPTKPQPHLRIVKVCVRCHKGFVKGSQHECVTI